MIPIVGNRSATSTLLKKAPQPPSSKPGMTSRETLPIAANRSAICTLLKKAPQLRSSMPGMTSRATLPIVGNRSAICTLLKAPQPRSSMPGMTSRATLPIAANRSAICTLLKKAPQPPQQHAGNDEPGDASNRGQSQRDLHASEESSAAAQQHAGNDEPGDGSSRGQSQRDLHTAPVSASNNPHSESSLNAGGGDQASIDDAGQTEMAAAPEFGHSFHFKNEKAASKASDIFEVHVDHGPDSTGHGQHAAGHDGLAPIPDADLIGVSLAEQNALSHARGAGHHVNHDLVV